jgi:hypothetical protein
MKVLATLSSRLDGVAIIDIAYVFCMCVLLSLFICV